VVYAILHLTLSGTTSLLARIREQTSRSVLHSFARSEALDDGGGMMRPTGRIASMGLMIAETTSFLNLRDFVTLLVFKEGHVNQITYLI
jgi:hypothetical protein